MSRRRLCLVCLLLVATVATPVAGAATASASASTTSSASCETTARHDAFRLDAETVNASANGSATSSLLNTQVQVEQATGFIRVNGSNPNGYCVRFVVEVAPEVVSPASLGTIDSTNSNHTATWRAVHDFNGSETYTEVEFVLGPGERAQFAPAKARVAALSWTGTAKDTASGLLGDTDIDIPYIGDSTNDLEKRSYEFSPEENGTTIITVPLQSEDGNQSIDEYHAVYRTDTQSWRPVGTDSSAPVFKRELEGGQAVQFQFNDPSAEVKFTANPTWTERRKHDWTAYWSGVDWYTEHFGGGSEDSSDDGWLPIAIGGVS